MVISVKVSKIETPIAKKRENLTKIEPNIFTWKLVEQKKFL